MGEEKDAKFYNDKYASSREYHKAPYDCVYYDLWCEILKNIKRGEKILDVGCGPGQFAKLALDKGHNYVRGVDFSIVSVDMARMNNPSIGGRFLVMDIMDDDVFNVDHDVVVFCEVLEHITKDIELLKKVMHGKHVIATVPSYDSAGHVRFFASLDDVKKRYGDVIRGVFYEIPIVSSKVFIMNGVIV